MREFLRVGGINIYDVLNEVFDSSALKGAVSFDCRFGSAHGTAHTQYSSYLPSAAVG